MWQLTLWVSFLLASAVVRAAPAPAETNEPWTPERIQQCLRALDLLKTQGLVTETHYAGKRAMLEARLKGTFKPTALSDKAADPNLIQNGGFEEINRNSAPNRSRWLWSVSYTHLTLPTIYSV